MGVRLSWRGIRLSWPVPLAVLALTLAALVTGAATSSPEGEATTGASWSCHRVVGPFGVRGTQVLGRGDEVFVSYGTTVAGLQGLNWGTYAKLDLEKIAATADDWCSNTVRLQLNQNLLLGSGGTSFDQAYMSAVESEVSTAEQYHLVVVLNDNTEFSPLAVRSGQRSPTPGTKTFWKDMASRYGNDPQVIFDLFNEPRTYSPGVSLAQKWKLWLTGGRFQGVFYSFGMAGLADYVRNTVGARNLFWVEGPDNSHSFAGMVRQHALLKVSGVVYALHHPEGPLDSASWYADFGYLVSTGVAPVVDGEWTNHEPVPTPDPNPIRSSCWPDPLTTVPAYLKYLAAHDIGMNAYDLEPGYLIKSYANMADPATINGRTWSCLSNAEPQPLQGAGSQILAWFRQYNH